MIFLVYFWQNDDLIYYMKKNSTLFELNCKSTERFSFHSIFCFLYMHLNIAFNHHQLKSNCFTTLIKLQYSFIFIWIHTSPQIIQHFICTNKTLVDREKENNCISLTKCQFDDWIVPLRWNQFSFFFPRSFITFAYSIFLKNKI